MNKINIKKVTITSVLALMALLLSAGITQAATFVLLTGQLDYGQTSTNVTNLQTFLASSPSIYPQGRITGYFGPLTKSAVMNFQNAYGIAQVGRVGPQTLAKINSLISSGVGLTGAGGVNYTNSTIAPTIYSISLTPSRTSAFVSWVTDEPTTAKVYYSSTPFQMAEATSNFAEPVITGGTTTQKTTAFQINQNVTIQNLQPNTLYYYMIEATDASGNLSYTWPRTFVTTN
jgi:peptidoglycan hydrolase-like protein with peptidoglycan-binding domain